MSSAGWEDPFFKRGFSVRKAEARDRDSIVSIIEGCDNLTGEEKDCAVELVDIYLTDPKQDDYHVAVAVDGREAVRGYVCYGEASLAQGVYDLYWIVVEREYRGMGIGSVLLEYVEGVVTVSGARMLVVETSSLPGYEDTRRFYLRSGFYEEARIRDFFKPGDDKIIFVKRFGGA